MDPGGGDHDDGDQCHQCQRGQEARAKPCASPWTAETAALLLGPGLHAEGRRDLLQEDDHGDAEGEPLDHRPGKQGHGPAELEHARRR